MKGRHGKARESTRAIELTQRECNELILALKSRHLVIVDDMWDSTDPSWVGLDIDHLEAMTSAIGKLWVDERSRSTAEDAQHVMQDETAHQSRTRLRSLESHRNGIV